MCRKRTPPVVCLRCLFLDYSYTGFPTGDWWDLNILSPLANKLPYIYYSLPISFIERNYWLPLNSDFLSIYFPISGSCLTNQDKQ